MVITILKELVRICYLSIAFLLLPLIGICELTGLAAPITAALIMWAAYTLARPIITKIHGFPPGCCPTSSVTGRFSSVSLIASHVFLTWTVLVLMSKAAPEILPLTSWFAALPGGVIVLTLATLSNVSTRGLGRNSDTPRQPKG